MTSQTKPDVFRQDLPFYKWDDPAHDWICEQHPFFVWPHDDCAGPGMLATSLLELIRLSGAPMYSIVISERGPDESWLLNLNKYNSEDDIEITPETGKAILGLIAKAKRPRKFPGLYCCQWDCEKEAACYIVGNLNNGVDNDTQSCEEHVGELLGTPDFLTENNAEWVISFIPESELLRYRTLAKKESSNA